MCVLCQRRPKLIDEVDYDKSTAEISAALSKKVFLRWFKHHLRYGSSAKVFDFSRAVVHVWIDPIWIARRR